MATVITAGNATNGLSFTADNTGAFDFKTGTGAGTTAISISSSQVATFTAAPIGAGMLTSGTSVASTSGTSIDFTGIPSWVKRITVMFQGVSTNGSSYVQIQLGDSGGIETSSYLGTASTVTASSVGTDNISSGFSIRAADAASVRHGQFVISLINPSTNTWVASGLFGFSNSALTTQTGGSKSLSDTLTQVRVTTVNGTDTFDAGTINILYE